MSLVGDRQAIADALSMAPGVKGYAKRPTAVLPGDAWPLPSLLERADGGAFTVTWRVFVILPQEEIAASDWIDSHHEQLVDALEDVGFVDRLEPVKLDTEAGAQYALQITMRSE